VSFPYELLHGLSRNTHHVWPLLPMWQHTNRKVVHHLMGKVNGIEYERLTWNGKQIVEKLITHSGLSLLGNQPDVTITVNGFAIDVEAFTKEMTRWLVNVGERNYSMGQRNVRDQIVEGIIGMIKINFMDDDD